ncbi:MAG: hypothetical protein R3F19_27920 [Verrucomicrobiales bacterium]
MTGDANQSFIAKKAGGGSKIRVGPWEIHQGGPPIAFPTPDDASKKAALDKATIPPLDDEGWKRTEDSTVNVSEKSALKERNKEVDYTFFQVLVSVPQGAKINTFQVKFDQVDDAARVWIFNSKNPQGKYFPDVDVLGGKKDLTLGADFKNEVAEGENRIVITQYDNYPVLNVIKGVRILVDGTEIVPPAPAELGVELFEHANYKGVNIPYVEGYHDLYSSSIGLNDVISSVKVAKGWKVTLYEHWKFGGKTVVLTEDTPDLKTLGFDNVTSCVKIEKQ